MAKISHILKGQRPLTVDLGDGETLNLTYRTGAITPANHDFTIDLVNEQRIGAALAKSLSLSLLSWDLTDDDGAAYSVTEDTLRQLPVRFLDQVFSAIQDDLVPNERKPKTSGGSF